MILNRHYRRLLCLYFMTSFELQRYNIISDQASVLARGASVEVSKASPRFRGFSGFLGVLILVFRREVNKLNRISVVCAYLAAHLFSILLISLSNVLLISLPSISLISLPSDLLISLSNVLLIEPFISLGSCFAGK